MDDCLLPLYQDNVSVKGDKTNDETLELFSSPTTNLQDSMSKY